MDSTFVRKDFYIEPPKEDASPKEWAEWLKKDNRKAAAHKAAHTRTLEHAEAPEGMQAVGMRKVGGVWRQAVAVGFSGDAESENGCTVEPIVESTQEQAAILHRMEQNRNVRGGKREGKSARRHKNKKRRKKGK
jgi:hypothetical protein